MGAGSGVVDAPNFGGPTVFSGSEEPGSTIALSGIAVSGDADDVFTAAPATVTGIPPDRKSVEGGKGVDLGSGRIIKKKTDLGQEANTASDKGSETATLTLTVTSQEGACGSATRG